MTLGTKEDPWDWEKRAWTNSGSSFQAHKSKRPRNCLHMVVALLGTLFSVPLLEVYNYNKTMYEKQCW